MANVSVIGAGSWGLALARRLCKNGHDVTVWSHREEGVRELREQHENRSKLPGVILPEEIQYTSSRWKRSVRAGSSIGIYQKHSRADEAFCDRWTDHCQRGERNRRVHIDDPDRYYLPGTSAGKCSRAVWT